MQRVTSRHNPQLKDVVRLIASARDRRKTGRCVLEGVHLVATYRDRFGPPETLIVSDAALERAEIRAVIAGDASRVVVVPAALLAEMATLPPEVGILAVVPTPTQPVAATGDFCLLLDGVQDPGNVGSMLRSAAAAGVRQVLLSPQCAFAWAPKVLRAGQGAHFAVDIHEDIDLSAWARAYGAAGGTVVAAVAHGGCDLYATPLVGRLAIAIGSEGAGLSAGLLAEVGLQVTIPMPGSFESLNAAAAAAVCLFECVRQRSGGR